MFHGEQNVQDVTYLNSEQLGDRADARRAIFDVYCENDKGEKFIVEMQNVYQEFFKDRTIYYSTFPIREQAQRGGDWDFHLNPVYTIGLLNFNFAEVRQEGTQTIRGQRQRLSRYSQRHKNSEKKKFAEGMAKGKAEGIAEGMAKGGKTAKVKIAANLLSLGVPMKTIIQASGLSEEEIKNMIQ